MVDYFDKQDSKVYLSYCTYLVITQATKRILAADIGNGSKAQEEQITIQRFGRTIEEHQR